MDPARFVISRFGKAMREPGNKRGFFYYLPNPIPRDLSLAPHIIATLSSADAALGHLQGLGMLITDPGLLIGPYLRREALASSRIEGTQASLSEVFQSEIGNILPNDATAEVARYLDASEQAYRLAKELPITQRLILQVHKTLLTGVRGAEKRPGEFRKSPVWVGSAGATPETALFVPPLPSYLGDLLSDWERFVNDDGNQMPPLIQAALMHYQFETIHPFLDGNGRIGRLLINVLLTERGRLPLPLLYLSQYFEMHRDEYYTRLQDVREKEAINEWFMFFLNAVKYQAEDAVNRSTKLIAIREEYRQESIKERSNLPRLVDIITRNPYVTVSYIANLLNLSNQGARQLIKKAEARGWLQSLGVRGRGGREVWQCAKIVAVLE